MSDKKPICDLSKSEKTKNPFFLGDVKDAGRDSFANVIIPAIQRLFVDTIRNWIETLVYGAPKSSGGNTNNRTGYSSIWGAKTTSNSNQQVTDYSKHYSSISVNDFRNYFDDDDITAEHRAQGITNGRALAEKVCMQLHEDWERYSCYSVLDFCTKTNQQYTSQANNWGWTCEPQVVRSGRGYRIDLPDPQVLNVL